MTALTLALLGCVPEDPGFAGGGNGADRENSSGDDTAIDADDTGMNNGGELSIDSLETSWEELPNSNTGCLLNLCYEFTASSGGLEGGEVYVDFQDLGDQWIEIGGSDARVLDEAERGCDAGNLYVGFDIDNDDYQLGSKLKDSSGETSEKYEVSIESDDSC